MRFRSLLPAWIVLAACAGCGAGGTASDASPPADALAEAMPPPPPDAGSDAASACEPEGRYGVPQLTFTLPVKSGAAINYADVQKSLPAVDWKALDRLYIPAGTYPQLMLGNLPVRDAAHPLVITNLGGQVKIGPSKGANYIWSMGGGAGWVLTGRYDATSKTGDAAFPGHRCGAYARSAGT